MYGLLARQTHFAAFATTAFPAALRNGSLDSVEDVHNQIHGLVGGDGHMTLTAFSAFDPMFFIHHAQIDRIWALFSAINPDSYVIPLKNDLGTFAQPAGITEDIDTPLFPFRTEGTNTFHTSATVRDMKTFGYSYPEIVDWGVSATQLASNVRTEVNRIYQRQTSTRRRRSSIKHESATQREWFINFQGLRGASSAITVNFYLGESPTDLKDWANASNLVVAQIVLPDNSASHVAPRAMAQIPLTRSLELAIQNGKLNGTDTNSVRTYLEENLQWTAILLSGDACEVATLEGLDVSVVDQEVVESGRIDQFHSYGSYHSYPELTWQRKKTIEEAEDHRSGGQGGRGGSSGSQGGLDNAKIMSFLRSP